MTDLLSFPPVIDSSMRSQFVACPHSFFRRYIQGLQLPHKSIHLHFGAAFADGIATFRQEFYGGSRPNVDDAAASAAAAIVRAWGDYPEAVEGSPKSLIRCIGALESYLAQYPPALDHVRPLIEDGIIHTEFNFAIPLPILHPETGEPLLYSGRFDMLGDMGGLKVIEDDKTTSQLGPTWGQQWCLRGQFTGYAWGASEFGHRIEGIVVRGISILKTQFGHAEVIEQRPRWMVESWKRQLHRDIFRMIDCWQEYSLTGDARSFDQDLDSACSSYGGCQFLDLCTSADPDKWLGNYEATHYDPLGESDA
jgi:hypothetical protein